MVWIIHHVSNLTRCSSIDVTIGTPGQKLSLQVDTGPFAFASDILPPRS